MTPSSKYGCRSARAAQAIACASAAVALSLTSHAAHAQSTGNRMLGLDVSAWQGNISQTTWNNISNIENRKFVFVRASRGGTTGEYHPGGGYPSTDNDEYWGSQRYDDPYYIQNVNRATAAGMYVGSYHFGRHDILASTPNSNPPGGTAGVANSGTDEADHYIQMAGPFMRPGYLPPTFDLEGPITRTDEEIAQFTLDFSNRIYAVMGIRPAIYINGNFAENVLGGASASLRNQLAQPAPNTPTPVSPAYSQVWTARWPNQADPDAILVQTAHPKDTYSPIYGPWDDYGTTHPWAFWQYASTGRLQSYNNGGSNLDFDVTQGDVEFLKNQLIPALWMNDISGDWSTLINWNSGQTPVAPVQGPGQLPRVGTLTMPNPRLPGAPGTGPTAGSNDTVILERPNANITVTLSSGTHNIRKLYMRESLNITGGSLTINYDPTYRPDNLPNVVHGGPISAQFSGPVSISGGASLIAHTVQVDPARNFTAGNASLTLDTLTLNRGATPAKLTVNGTVTITPLAGATAVINTNTGAGSAGLIDLAGGTRAFNIADGAALTDLNVQVPITNGSLTKSGPGTMRLNVANALSGVTTIDDGILEVTGANQLGSSVVTTMPGTVGGTMRLSGNVSYNVPLAIGGAGANGGNIAAPGNIGALDNASGTNTWAGTITLNGTAGNVGAQFNQISAAAGTLVLSGVIQDGTGASWGKTLDGDVVVTGGSPNTYTHLTRLLGGRLIIEKDGALGAAGSNSSATGNTFQLAGSASTLAFRAPAGSPGVNYATFEVINTDGTGAAGLGQVDNLGGDNTFAGQIALGGPTSAGVIQSSIGVNAGSLHVTGGLYARANAMTPRNITKLGPGRLILSADSSFATANPLVTPLATSTFNVNNGTVELRSPSAHQPNLPGVTTWNVNAGAAMHLASGQLGTSALNVAGGNVTIAPGAGKFIRTEQLSVTGGGKVDIAESDIIIDYADGGASPLGSFDGAAYTGITGLIASTYSFGEWNGPSGITSSAAAASQWLTTVAVADAAGVFGIAPTDTHVWNGQTVDGTSVLVMYTYSGDLDLNGYIDAVDYGTIDNWIQFPGTTGYQNGDINYDGIIDAVDYGIIDNTIQLQGPPLGDDAGGATAAAAADITAVPEPGAACVITSVGAILAMRRRHRRHCRP